MCKEEDNSTAITKIINSESASYRPTLTDTLVLDAVPTVNSFNSVTSDAVARAIAGASGEVPQVTENDNGKVLKAIYDAGGPAVEWGEATVDQTYNATSTNAQSGVAVASAIAAIPSEVTTASGHFDLEGSVPVTVNYTGTPHVVPGTATFTNPTITEIGQTGLAVVFTLNPAHALTATESGALNIPANSPVTASVTVSYTSSTSSVGGPGITADPSLPNSYAIIQSGTYTLTSQYVVPGFDQYVGLMFSLQSESDRPSLKAWAESLTLGWPSSVVDGYETTIPVVDQNYHSESANAQSGVAVAQAIAAIPSASYTAGDGINIDSNNRISVNPDSTLKNIYTARNMDVSTMENIGQNAPAYIDLEGRHSNEVLEHVINDFPLDSSIQVKVIFGTGLYCNSLGQGSDVKAYLIFSDDPNFNGFYATPYEMSASYDTIDNRWVLQSQTVVVDTPVVSHGAYVVGVRPTDTLSYVSFAFGTSLSALTSSTVARQDWLASVQLKITYPDYTSPIKIGVSNPLPAFSSADAGRVLQVQNDGTLAWVTLS